jgi:hypothetical protein
MKPYQTTRDYVERCETAPCAPAGLTDTAKNELERLAARLGSVLNQLRDNADRALGSNPACGNGGQGAAPCRAGMLGDVLDRIDMNHALVDAIQAEANRLDVL